jgi:hypothetical protein
MKDIFPSNLQVPDRSAAAKAGLIATRRGLAGNILLGDIIIAVGETTVSILLTLKWSKVIAST